jgi:hypothetical protein
MTDVTTIKVQGQTVWFEALTDEQVDDALTHMPPTQQRILGLAGRGLEGPTNLKVERVRCSSVGSF